MSKRKGNPAGNPPANPTAGRASVPFAWSRDDLESRLGFQGGRYTRVLSMLWLFVAGILTVATFGAMTLAPENRIVEMFTKRGPVQYVIVLFTYWSLLMVLVKMSKTKLQRKALKFTDLVPIEADFVLSAGTVSRVQDRLRAQCDEPQSFMLFNRIDLALRNLKNLGRIGDVDDILRAQSENDENVMESSYSLLRGLIWSIPVLGFIGTVQGLSSAIGGFGQVLSQAQDLTKIKPALTGVTGGLATAFDTTFVALVAVLGVHLLMTMARKSEEDLLDACNDYCQQYVVSRLKITGFDSVD